jgi:hypothetical protein
LAITVALPALVLAVTTVGSGWQPVGIDTALEVLRSWEVGTRHTPLVGAYSRYGWDHPGPLQFIVSAPGVRLFGPEGLLVTAGLVNTVAAAGAVLAAHRTAGMPLALPTAVATAVMLRAMTGVGVTDPWNPYVAVVPFLAYLLCVWGAVHGDRVLLVAAVVAGSWCAQAHLGYLPIAVAAAVLAGGLRIALRRYRRGAEVEAMPRRWVVAATAIGLVLWLPPLVDQIAHDPGNLGLLFAFARNGTTPTGTVLPRVGWSPAVAAMSGMVTVPAPWTRPLGPNLYLTVPEGEAREATALLVGLAVVGGLAWWRGRRGPAALAGLSIALVGVSVVVMARATDDLFGYLIRWTWGVSALVWIALAWAVIVLVQDLLPAAPDDAGDPYDPDDPDDPDEAHAGRAPRLAGIVTTSVLVVGFLVVAVLGVRTVDDGLTRRVTHGPGVVAIAGLSRQLRAELDPDVTYVLVADSNWHYRVAPGLAVDLILHGYHVLVTPNLARQFKPWRAADPDQTYPQIVLVPTVNVPDWRKQHPTAHRIAVHEPTAAANRTKSLTRTPHEAWLLAPPQNGSGFALRRAPNNRAVPNSWHPQVRRSRVMDVGDAPPVGALVRCAPRGSTVGRRATAGAGRVWRGLPCPRAVGGRRRRGGGAGRSPAADRHGGPGAAGQRDGLDRRAHRGRLGGEAARHGAAGRAHLRLPAPAGDVVGRRPRRARRAAVGLPGRGGPGRRRRGPVRAAGAPGAARGRCGRRRGRVGDAGRGAGTVAGPLPRRPGGEALLPARRRSLRGAAHRHRRGPHRGRPGTRPSCQRGR